ncbi:MAG: hypothetical protein IJD70_05460 [Clostridia bacterium]|nr:hypothetical protein [Clostridia bacterium]
MKNIRILSLFAAIVMILSCLGCNSELPEETTEKIENIENTESPESGTEGTELPESTEPEVTEPPFPIYEGPSSEFKFTAESVLPSVSYITYTDFIRKADKSYLVPALAGKMIPQGMDIWEERGWLLISGYFPSTDISDCSILVAVDMNTGAYVGEYYLTNMDGTPHSSHAGGVAVTDKNVYIANGSKLYRVPLTELLKAGQCGKITIADEISVPVRASFCNYSGGYLWVGDFQYSTSHTTDEYRHMTNREGKKYYAWTVGYELDESTENGLKAEAMVKDSFATPDVIFSMTERIQGFAATENTVALSQSYGRTNKSTIFLYENPIGDKAHKTTELNGKSVPVYFLDSKVPSVSVTAPPMSEGLAVADGDLYILFESAADKYANGGGKDPTENVWKMPID